MTTTVCGKISRLSADMADGNPVATFRVGSILCRAKGGVALSLVAMRGLPSHTVEVDGELDGKVLAVTKVVTVD